MAGYGVSFLFKGTYCVSVQYGNRPINITTVANNNVFKEDFFQNFAF
jgi:hypothetical protein